MKRGRHMKARITFVFTIIFFSLLILFYSSGQQKAQRKVRKISSNGSGRILSTVDLYG
jgi:preprotein translocase subunit SecG